MERTTLIRKAKWLAIITIGYNVVEGLISVLFGLQDDTLALFGFGVDSFVEIISGAGILHMIFRMERANGEKHDSFERLALFITGVAFYLLTFGLIVTTSINIYAGKVPDTTFWGIIVSLLSIFSMYFLMRIKLTVGRQLNSEAIIQDAYCTRICIYLSLILLLSSIGFELTKIGYIDSIGALGIAYLSWKEGKESFQKAHGEICTCCSCEH